MMLVYPPVNLKLDLSDECVTTLIIENQNLFCEILGDFQMQLSGGSGALVLSEHSEPLPLLKHCEIISRFIPFELNTKELQSRLISKLKKIAVREDFVQSTNDFLAYAERYVLSLCSALDCDISTASAEDISPLFKMFQVSFDEGAKTVPEQLLCYCANVTAFLGERVFVTVNLRSFVDDCNAELLFQTLVAHHYRLLAIESAARPYLKCEQRTIIDSDCCII